jgi:CRP/FNR family transcriptional regulator, anaerobic regulatory protein
LKLIHKILNQFTPINEEEIKILLSLLIEETVKKDEFILQEGRIAKKMYFLNKGLIYCHYTKEDKQVINWFAKDGDFFTSMYSFISQKPSYESIQAIEDSMFYSISYENLQMLYQKHPTFDKIGRLIVEKYYIEVEENIIAIKFKTAKERYDELQEKEPNLLQRVSLGKIASYLGINQETLSRIRGKK